MNETEPNRIEENFKANAGQPAESEAPTDACVIFEMYEGDLDSQRDEMVADVTEEPDLVTVEEPAVEGDDYEEAPTNDELINAAVLRNNDEFFGKHMKTTGIINKLHAKGIISDEDMRYIKTLTYGHEKIDVILGVIRNSSSDDFKAFVSYLRESGQTLVADVAEKGGAVLKIKVKFEPAENLEEMEKQISLKLNQLQDKTVPKSEEVWRFVSQMKKGNIEIVSSQQGRGVVIWCWCRSESAIKLFEDLTESEPVNQPNLLNDLFSLLLPGKGLPTINFVYLENHEEGIVYRRPRSIRRSPMNVTIDGRRAFGVTTIETRICILCQSPNAIIVYEEGDWTKPSKELSLYDVVTPMDMAYSKESQCLYVTDKGTASVWRIAFPSPDKVDRWLDSVAADPFTLSVTNDGRMVMMVKRGPPSCLEIYNPDTKQLLLHLDLPTPILKPSHAVETSKGNFVVSYDGEFGVQGGVCVITKEGQLISLFEAINGVPDEVDKLTQQKCLTPSHPNSLIPIGVWWPYLAGLGGNGLRLSYLAIDDKDQVYGCDDSGLAVFDSRLFLLEDGRSSLKGVHRVHYFREKMQLIVLHRK